MERTKLDDIVEMFPEEDILKQDWNYTKFIKRGIGLDIIKNNI